MVEAVPVRIGARAIARQALRAQLSGAAKELFQEQGFESTTIDDIAARAGVSSRTFYRYYDSREEIVLGWVDDPGPLFRQRLSDRPKDEPIWEALRRAFDPIFESPVELLEPVLLATDLAAASRSLLARVRDRSFEWEDMLSDVIAERLGVDRRSAVEVDVLAACALGALRGAFIWWRQHARHQPDAFARALDTAFAAVPAHTSVGAALTIRRH